MYVYQFWSISVAPWIFCFGTCLSLCSWQVYDLFSGFLDLWWRYHQVIIFMPMMMFSSDLIFIQFLSPPIYFLSWTLVNFGPWPKIAICVRYVYGGIMGLLPIWIWCNMKLDIIIVFASLGLICKFWYNLIMKNLHKYYIHGIWHK